MGMTNNKKEISPNIFKGLLIGPSKHSKRSLSLLKESFFIKEQEKTQKIIGQEIARVKKLSYLKKNPILFFRGGKTDKFFTEDSKLYITPKEQELLERGTALNRNFGFDSLSAKIIRSYVAHRSQSKADFLLDSLEEKFFRLQKLTRKKSKNFTESITLAKAWNFSIVGAILLGMFSMALIYRYLGTGASATDQQLSASHHKQELMREGKVLGAETEKSKKEATDEENLAYLEAMVRAMEKENSSEKIEKEIREMVKGYPIEKMIPDIAEKDKVVAAFLISIAKKESNWGKRVPVLDGKDCYNYWGYKGIREKMGTGGHTCFNSRKDAVDTVAKRLETLIKKEKLDTPAELIVWKCGSSCAGHSRYDVQKWISDVNLYFKELNN